MEFTLRRVVLFVLISALLLISWQTLILPNFLPPPNVPPGQQQAEQDPAEPDDPADEDEDAPADAQTADDPAVAQKRALPKPGEVQPPRHPRQEDITLGSLDPDSGYFYRALLTTEGAALTRIELNDPRYRDLFDEDEPLALTNEIVGKAGEVYRTFQTQFPEIQRLLARHEVNLETVDWDWDQRDASQVSFTYTVPNAFELTKTYQVRKGSEGGYSQDIRDANTEGYFLNLTLSAKNLQEDQAEVSYVLQGPVGMPLEDAESTRKFRDIKLGTIKNGNVVHDALTSKDLMKAIDKGDVEDWSSPFRYVGVDGQFFATLIYNDTDEPTTERIEKYTPQAVFPRPSAPQQSEVSVLLTAKPQTLASGESFEHQYTLYAGPKRQALLEPMQAAEIMEFGWFGWISKGMLAVLSFLHNVLFLPYGLAIIGLTIMVRGVLFPLSKKQAHSAARMKELQPKLQELKKRYGDDKQKFAQAQMDLFRESGYNPFAGCLPMVFQLPIFIGLYSALSHAVDLRAASFLWVDNLAAPDALFRFPFSLPFLGHNFNLLPLLTVALFIVQQKMFMPPPAPDDEQAQLQHKMMNFMMIFMGFLFYHVPAGLCVYFIASSLWGMGERKLLDFGKSAKKPEDGEGAKSKSLDGGGFKTLAQNGREKRSNVASKKRGKKSKSRR